MDIEYNLMSEAPLEILTNLVERAGYRETKDDMDYIIFRNKDFIGLRLEGANEESFEDSFDFYQGERRDKKEFVKNPKSYLFSDIDEYSMIDEEYLIEEGQLERKLNEREVQERLKKDFESINNSLIRKGYKTDFYETKQGFDI